MRSAWLWLWLVAFPFPETEFIKPLLYWMLWSWGCPWSGLLGMSDKPWGVVAGHCGGRMAPHFVALNSSQSESWSLVLCASHQDGGTPSVLECQPQAWPLVCILSSSCFTNEATEAKGVKGQDMTQSEPSLPHCWDDTGNTRHCSNCSR